MQIDYLSKKCWSEIDEREIPFSKQKVGIIDGPINSQLVKKIKNKKYFNDDGEMKDSVDLTHASIVCSIIQNISPLSEISVAQVFSEDGEKAATKNIVAALRWLVVEEKVNIINMSLGFYNNCLGYCDWDRRLKQIKDKYKVVVIVSAGNACSEHPNASITSPGCSAEVITVGGLDKCLKISNEMNVNKIDGKPELYANGSVEVILLDGQKKVVNGTSFAAPIITGLVTKYYAHIVYSSVSKKKFSEDIKNIFQNIIFYIQNVSGQNVSGMKMKGNISKLEEVEDELNNTYEPTNLEINNLLIIDYLEKKLSILTSGKVPDVQKKAP